MTNLTVKQARLRAEERESLVLAALGARRLRSFDELRDATGMKGRYLRGALERLERAGVVRSEGERASSHERFWRGD